MSHIEQIRGIRYSRVCRSVRQKSVLYGNDWTNRAGFSTVTFFHRSPEISILGRHTRARTYVSLRWIYVQHTQRQSQGGSTCSITIGKLNVIRIKATAMRPMATSTVAACYRYCVIGVKGQYTAYVILSYNSVRCGRLCVR